MSLIKCIECGKEYSNKATACPNCGCPTTEQQESEFQVFVENAVKNFECKYCGAKTTNHRIFHNKLSIECKECGRINQAVLLPEKFREPDKLKNAQCPYCHSTNTKKISSTSRAASLLTFGFASKKIGKQWHCNKCGSDF